MFLISNYTACFFPADIRPVHLQLGVHKTEHLLVLKLNCMTFSTQLSVHFRHTAISVAQMHRFIRDTCTDICCTCGVFRLHGLSLKDQTRFWCLRLVTNVNIVFIEVMVLFVKAVKDRNARKSSEQNLYVSMYI